MNQFIDFDQPIGIAYERCIGYEKPPHIHDRFTITFPRGSSRSSMRMVGPAQEELFRLDESWVHLMPSQMLHEQGTYSAVYDTFAIFPTAELLNEVVKSITADSLEQTQFFKFAQKLKRTPLIDDLVGRYFFSVVMMQEQPSEEIRFMEREILRLVVAAALKTKVPSVTGGASTSHGVAKALEFIESNLFVKLDVAAITRHSRMSQATLFRQFKKEIKQAPLAYIRSRRLDESLQLLKTGRYAVSDVAILVCYEDLSSFSKAFKNRFRKSPPHFLNKPLSSGP